MKLSFPRRSMRNFRVLNACLLSLLMFTSPILPIAAPVAARNRELIENSTPLVTKNVAGSIAVSVSNRTGTHATAGGYTNMPFFTPSLTATLADDIGLGAKKNPGDTVTYTATITNGGASPADDATGMVFSAILDNSTTLVSGSINAQPIAKPDSYTGSGNIPISIAAPGVLANDIDPMTGTNSGLTVNEVQGAAANVGVAVDTTAVGAGLVKGSVILAGNGSFTYEPPPGYVGADTFTYKTSEGTLTDTNTVTITISNMVWFVKNTGGGSNRGTFSNPFTSIASFNTANALADAAPNPKSGDVIALRSGTYAETDGVNLRNNQKLIGEAVQFNTVFTVDSNSSSAYTTFAAGTNTAPTIATSGGNGIDLASGNTVRGLNVGNTPAFFGFNGGIVGSPVINTVAKTGTGGAINVSTSGAFGANVTFATLESSSSPGANINLVGVTGTLGITSSGTGLTGSAAGSHAINISGGSVGFTYAANVTKNNLGSLLNVSGGHTGTLVFNTGTLDATAGDGLQFNNADGSYTFSGTTTLHGGDAGVDIIGGSDGTFSFASTSSITDPSGTSFNINGGAGNVTYNGTITDDVGVLVSVVNTTGGTKSFTGAITDGDDGDGGAAAVGSINLDNNDGATITFSGGLLVNTGANGGFWAINGGTVNVCAVKPCSGGAAVVNKVTSTTGRTVRVEGTDFGTNGLTFQRIASSGAQNGIRIDTTGASGFFTVTGTGADDSGGSIVNSTQDGVFLNSTRNITLTEMVINNSGQSQIDAATVNGLTLTGVETDDSADHGILGSLITTMTISGCVFVRGGDNAGVGNKDGVFITNLRGTSSVTNTTFSNSNTIQMFVLNNTATAAAPAEPTDVLTVSGTTWNQHTGPFAGDHLSVQSDTGGNFKLIVNSTSAINTFTTGGTAVQAASSGSGTVKASVTGVRATAPMTAGVVIGATASSNAKFDIFSNKIANGTGFSGMGSVSIAVTCVTSGTCNGFIHDNTITHTAGAGVDATHVILQGNGTVNAEVFSNVVTGNFQRGFYGSSGTGSGTVNMNFHNNNYTGTANAAAGALQGVYIEAGNSAGGPSSQVCLDMAANSVTMVDTTAYRLRNEVTAGNCAGCVFKLKNYLGGGTDTAAISSWITGAPNSNTFLTTSGTPISIGTNNPYSNGSGGCPAPVFLRAAPGGVEAVERRRTVGSSYLKEAAREGLTQFELDGIFGAAIKRWEATGLTTEQIKTMRSLKFEIADLPGSFLGETNSDRILIDRDAGGRGWYLGSDSLSDSLFNNTVSITRRYTDPRNAPAGQIDLLTAVEHEIGHKLGLDDSYLEKDRDSIMYGYLTVGERRAPARGQAKGVPSAALKGSHFLSFSTAKEAREIWSAVASAARQRFGSMGSESKAPSPLRSAGALQMHHAKPLKRAASDEKPLSPLSGETVTVNGAAGAGFTLPGGDSVTLTFQATVNTPPTARSVSVQGKVSGSNFTLVNGISTANPNTNDPETAAVNDATVTNINTVSTWTGATSTDWKTFTNWTPNTYAPGVGNAAVNDVFIPNVGQQPNIDALVGDVNIYSLNISANRTLTIDPARILTIGGAPGGDLTLDGIISGGQLRFGTGTHAFNNLGGTGSLSATNVLFVISGSTVTLNHNLQAGALAVSAGGSMNITGKTISLNGSGAALGVAGTFTTATSTIVLNGTAAQTIAGTTYNNLTINNTLGAHVTGVTLIGNATVNGVLTLTSSDLATGANTLTMPNTATSAPATGATDVVGNVKRTNFVSGGTALSFGNPLNTIRINSGTAPSEINVLLAKNAPATFPSAVSRSYTITPTGGSSINATVRLHYRQAELNSNLETPTGNFNLRRFNGSLWQAVVPTSRNVGVVEDNWLENNTVTTFSEWTFANLSPSAAAGTVSGIITTSNGTSVEGAVVRLSGDQNRKTITDAKGRYSFDGVDINGFYTVTPSRANYHFNPFNRAFTQLGNQTEAAFGAAFTGDNANPLDTTEYFVRQQYVDLLGREPDEGGFNYWSDEILKCGADVTCVNTRRSDIAAAFFIEQEFQQTGAFIYDVYQSSLGRKPGYSEYTGDRKLVIGGPDLETEKTTFAAGFVKRAEFVEKYQDHTTGESFVDALLQEVWKSANVDLGAQRGVLLGLYQTGADMNQSRALVLRQLVADPWLKQGTYNPAFVLTEYFAYLRRNPEPEGYDFWLNVLNNREGGNFRGMVCSFITSAEYQNRFSSVVSHNNAECGK